MILEQQKESWLLHHKQKINNSKWITDLNKTKSYIDLVSSKIQQKKLQKEKLAFMKIKNCCSLNDM